MVVEDEPLVASLLCDVLKQAGFEARTAPDAVSAQALVEEFDPDGALIDINLGPGPHGLHLGHLLNRTRPDVGLVFLTKYQDPRVSGASGWTVPEGSAFLAKDRISDTKLLMDAIESVLNDSKHVTRHDKIQHGDFDRLTAIQLEILRLAALGLTNSAIARRRGTLARTVEQRLKTVYQTLGIVVSPDVNPRVEAIRRYIATLGLPTDEQ